MLLLLSANPPAKIAGLSNFYPLPDFSLEESGLAGYERRCSAGFRGTLEVLEESELPS